MRIDLNIKAVNVNKHNKNFKNADIDLLISKTDSKLRQGFERKTLVVTFHNINHQLARRPYIGENSIVILFYFSQSDSFTCTKNINNWLFLSNLIG